MRMPYAMYFPRTRLRPHPTPALRGLLRGLLISCGFICSATVAQSNYTLHHTTGDDGLPQSSVRAIAQDPSGFIWVGTEAGLARYDGYRFRNYEPPFGHGVVDSIFADSTGRIWASWYDKPSTVLNPRTNEWALVDIGDQAYYRLEMAEDPNGRIWASGGSGISYYDDATGSFTRVVDTSHYKIGPGFSHRQFAVWLDGIIWVNSIDALLGIDATTASIDYEIPLKSDQGRTLWQHNGALWLCNGEGVYRLDGRSSLIQIFADPDKDISSCAHSNDGSLWVGKYSSGIMRFENNGEITSFRRDPTSPFDLASDEVLHIQTDRHGGLWFVTPGVAHLFQDERIRRFVHSPGSIRGFIGGVSTFEFVEDRSGVIWFGTEGSGLARISRYAEKFQVLTPPSEIDLHVRQPVTDLNGDLWIGMNQDGVFRFNRSIESWTHFPAQSEDGNGLPSAETRAMLVDDKGQVWAGSVGGILSRRDVANNRWERFELNGQAINTLLAYPDGRIIVGQPFGVVEFDPASQQWQHYPFDDDGQARSMILSHAGTVFIGTHQGAGVVEFESGKGVIRRWSDQLGDVDVFSLYEDRLGFLWIGTWGDGLLRLNPRSGEIQAVSTADGLPNNTIYSVLSGSNDDIWLSTDKGLARIDACISSAWPCRPQIQSFDTSDGLPGLEFDSEAHLKSPTGELFFGGPNGLIHFRPGEIGLNPVEPVLALSDLRLNGRPLLTDGGRPDFSVVLDNDFGVLELKFSALDFHRPESNQYRYRFSASAQWSLIDGPPHLILSNLRSGSHLVEIQASNNDGLWSTESLLVSFDVLAPGYLRWPALVAYFLLVLVVVYVVARQREHAILRKNRELERHVEERTEELNRAYKDRNEFFANISHEIRTPLTLLVGGIEKLEQNIDETDDRKITASIRRHSKHLLRFVDSLTTISHLSSSPNIEWYAEDLSEHLRNLVVDLQNIVGNKTINFDCAETGRFMVKSCPHALDSIFTNLLGNSIKHTPDGGQIDVYVFQDEDYVNVSIADSGTGIDPKALHSVFERGVRGKNNRSDVHGYGIGLSLVRQSMEALGGSIRVRDNSESGACFDLRFILADGTLPIASYPSDVESVFAETHYATDEAEPATNRRSGELPIVLVVEDHDELRLQISEQLCDEFHVIMAANATSAIELARKEIPDIIVCDVMLPDGNGFDVVNEIRSHTATEHIAVIILTALADEESRLRGLRERADAYITKPFSQVTLQLTVKNLLQERRSLLRFAAMQLWREHTHHLESQLDRSESFENRFMHVLAVSYSDSDCNVQELAKALGVSRRQLERKSKFYFDKSPNSLLSEYRLNQAARKLLEGRRVLDVSIACGFSSQSHFGAVFKQRFGSTPSEYANQERAEHS